MTVDEKSKISLKLSVGGALVALFFLFYFANRLIQFNLMTLVDSEEVDTLSAAAVSKEYQTLFWVPMLFQTAKNAETMIEDMLDLIQDFHDQTLSNSLKDNDGRRMSSDFHKAPGQHKRRQQILGEKLDSEVNTATRVDVVLKSENSKYILLSTLKKHFLFSQLRDYELDDVIDVMQALYVPEDEVIIQEGDAGDMFYILEEGAYEVLIGDEHVATCEAPQPFGDLALMYNAPRAATIKAIEPCTLWTLDRVFFRQAMVTSSSNQNVQLSQFLSKITLFETIGVQKLNQLARSLTKQSYDDGQYIIKQGDIGDQFYVLYKGQVKVSMTDDSGNEKYLLSLHEGEVFGERALIRKEPRKANIVAEGAVECYYLEAHDFYSMLGEFVDKFTKINEFRILRGCDVFSKLSDYKLKELLGKLTMHRMFSGQRVVCDYQEIFFVIDGVYESTHGTKYNSDNVQIGSLQQGAGEVAGALTLFSDEGQLACIAKDVIMTAIAEDALEQKNKRNSFIGGSSISSANSNSSGMSMLKMDGNLDTEKEIQLTRSRRKAAAHQRRQSLANNICESLDGLELIQPLGKGTFGSVFLCQHKVTRKLMALKCLDKRALVDSGQHHYVRREIIALSNFQHPFLSEYYGAVLSARKIFFVLEFISGGELWSYLYDTSSNIKKGPYGGCELQEATLHAATVILALEHIHGLGYSYRDLKPENLLISSNGYLKLVDFGFAKQVPFEGKNQQIQYRTFTLCGTPDYMAPELVLTQGHDKSADYWAYGVLLYEMIRGDTPFSSNNQQRTFEKIVHSQKHLSFPPDFNPHCKSLIRRLLHPNAALRLGALQNGVDDIKNHAFFTMQGLNFTKLLAQEIPMSYIPPVFVPGKSDMCGSTSIDHMDLDFEKNMDVDDDLNAYFETLLLNVDEVTEE